MKTNFILVSAMAILMATTAAAQTDLQNTGTLYISGSSDILYITGAFTNASTSALTNNGQLYVLKNLSNSQSAMAIGTGTLYLQGTAAQQINGTQVFKTFNLSTNNSAGFTLNNNLDVSGTHTFVSGLIASSATPNYLIYEAGSSYTGDGDAAHVSGWVKKFGSTNFSFPIGSATYERKVNVNTLSASSELNALYHGGVPPNNSTVQSPLYMIDNFEYWEINKISGGTAQITMNWDNSKVFFPSWNLSDIRSAYNNGGIWINEAGSATGNVSTTGQITTTTVGSFGFFTFGGISYTVPLQFVSINAQRVQGNTLVEWKVAQDADIDHYEIERSNNNGAFAKIGNTASQHSNSVATYDYTDMLPLQGIAYYRVRSIDRNGMGKYSSIVAVSDASRTDMFKVVANPVHQAIYLTASDSYKGAYQYELYNAVGQLMQNGQIRVEGNGITTLPLTAGVIPGMYILNVHNELHKLNERILVK